LCGDVEQRACNSTVCGGDVKQSRCHRTYGFVDKCNSNTGEFQRRRGSAFAARDGRHYRERARWGEVGGAFVTTSLAQLTLSAPPLIAAVPGDNVQFTVSATSPQGLPVSINANSIPIGASFDPTSHAFSWIPLSNQMGSYSMTFTGRDISGATASAVVKISVATTRDAVGSAQDAASQSPAGVCSPGAVATITGLGFTSQAPTHANGIPLPTQLAGVEVLTNGQALPLFYASSSQITFQCPLSPLAGTALSVTVETEDGTLLLNAFQSKTPEAAPGIYTLDMSGSGQGTVTIGDSTLVAMPVAPDIPSRPAHVGEYITIWANGLGPTTSGAPNLGMSAAVDPLVTTTDSVTVVIGGEELQPIFSGLAPSLVGTYQVNVQVPADAPLGSAVPVYIQVTLSDGTVVKSNQVTIAVDVPPSE